MLQGIQVTEWPAEKLPPTEEEQYALIAALVVSGLATFQERRPFTPFDETSLTTIRRVAVAVIGDRNYDVARVMDHHLRTFGKG
jgi:hypothetical protein